MTFEYGGEQFKVCRIKPVLAVSRTGRVLKRVRTRWYELPVSVTGAFYPSRDRRLQLDVYGFVNLVWCVL